MPTTLRSRVDRIERTGERGAALVVALMATMLLSALGLALILTTTTETKITGNYVHAQEALYAADAAIERTVQDVLTVPDWNNMLSGANRSAFVDGAANGPRTLPNGAVIDLVEATNMINCGKLTSCSPAEMDTRRNAFASLSAPAADPAELLAVAMNSEYKDTAVAAVEAAVPGEAEVVETAVAGGLFLDLLPGALADGGELAAKVVHHSISLPTRAPRPSDDARPPDGAGPAPPSPASPASTAAARSVIGPSENR